MPRFGTHIRRQREALRRDDPRYSVRQLARRIGVEPSYLSKVERELEPPPSEPKIRALARELGEDPDSLLAMAGKVSIDLQIAIRKRPLLFARLIRELRNLPDTTVLRLIQNLQTGKTKRRNRDRTEQ
jgi:transcriptional regulator with XRE-family HTH domain